MTLDEITPLAWPLVLSTDAEVDDAERRLGLRFPAGYREYVTRFGAGTLGGVVRVYPPGRVLGGVNNFDEWRRRVADYWSWDDGRFLTQEEARKCVPIGDTVGGDELVVHPRDPEAILVLPKDSPTIGEAGRGLADALDWLLGSGVLSEPTTDRGFDPAEITT